jgi:hypothetical protein
VWLFTELNERKLFHRAEGFQMNTDASQHAF